MADQTPEHKRQEEERKRQEAEQKRQQEQREKQRQDEQRRQEEERKRQQAQQPSSTSPNSPSRAGSPASGRPRQQGSTMATTYNASRNDPGVVNAPVGYPASDAEDPYAPRTFTHEELEGFARDLPHATLGWMELDETGEPTGEVHDEIPPPGKPVARVMVNYPAKFDEVVTPAGAPLTKMMQPEPSLWDEGMMARNPIPDTEQIQEEAAKRREKQFKKQE